MTMSIMVDLIENIILRLLPKAIKVIHDDPVH
jgi:hypothetical protein